jgi:hypothetical protein
MERIAPPYELRLERDQLALLIERYHVGVAADVVKLEREPDWSPRSVALAKTPGEVRHELLLKFEGGRFGRCSMHWGVSITCK